MVDVIVCTLFIYVAKFQFLRYFMGTFNSHETYNGHHQCISQILSVLIASN